MLNLLTSVYSIQVVILFIMEVDEYTYGVLMAFNRRWVESTSIASQLEARAEKDDDQEHEVALLQERNAALTARNRSLDKNVEALLEQNKLLTEQNELLSEQNKLLTENESEQNKLLTENESESSLGSSETESDNQGDIHGEKVSLQLDSLTLSAQE